MKGVSSLKHTCQGESHKATYKPCQDFSQAESKDAYAVAVVSDGHGGARYFRSDKGSELAVRCAKKAIAKFVKETSNTLLFKGKILTQIGINPEKSDNKVYTALSWLVSSIIRQWNSEILKDAQTRSITEWEQQHVEQKYLDEFTSSLSGDEGTLEKIYGCTLMAYVMTEEYWFAFQIGDGKMVFFNLGDQGIEENQFIPWDDKCFLNKTTSICDSDAASEFRFAYCGDGSFPEAVFLGSDGIDDTYGDGDKLTDFYIRIYKEIATSSPKQVKKTLASDLPIISKMGSQDDMSIACIYWNNNERVHQNARLMSQWQLAKLHQESNVLETKKSTLREKIERLKDSRELIEKQRIELTYAENDLRRVEESLEKIEGNVQTILTFDLNLNKQN